MKKIFIVVALFLFYNYERISMRNMVLGPLGIEKGNMAIPLFLFAVSLIISCSLYRRKNSKSKFVNSCILLCTYIYAVSLLHGFATIDLYLLLLMPIITLVFGSRVASDPNNDTLMHVLFIMVFVGIVYLFFSLERYSLYYGDREFFHSNSSYYVLYFLPILLCIKSNWIKYGAFLVTILVVLISAKRGGTIALALGLLAYFAVERRVQKRRNIRIGYIVGAFIVLVGSYIIINRVLFTTSDFLVYRFIEADDYGETGRGTIYPVVFEMISNSSFAQLLIGHGYDRVRVDSPIGLSAHNDYLEMAYDIGIIGLIILVVFLFRLIKYEMHLIKKKSLYASRLAFSIAVLLANMMVSHIIFSPGFLMLFFMLYGYIVGKEELKDSKTIIVTNENRSISIPVGD